MDYTPNDPAQPPPYSTIPPVTPLSAPPSAAVLSDNMVAALAYVTFIPAVIFLVTAPYNKSAFIRFHSMQSIALFVVWVGCVVLQMVLMIVPIIGFLISLAIGLGLLITWAFTVFKAYQGEWFKLPVIGDFAMSKAQV